MRVAYDNHGAITSTGNFTNALILTTGYGYAIQLNGWAKANVVPIGETASIQVWELYAGTWTRSANISVSAGRWYPFHSDISATAEQVAFVPVRSDAPGAGYMLLDDIYLYAPADNAPYCNGQYPVDVVSFTGGGFDSGIGGSTTTIMVPVGKDCPTAVMRPNNLWGLLLAQVTVWLDGVMALAPSHVMGSTRDLARTYMIGPLGGVVSLAVVVLDWRIPLAMLSIYLAFEVGLGIVGIWKLIRRTFFV
jgi:hypothetical protein